MSKLPLIIAVLALGISISLNAVSLMQVRQLEDSLSQMNQSYVALNQSFTELNYNYSRLNLDHLRLQAYYDWVDQMYLELITSEYSPPVDGITATKKALEYGGWNRTSLQDMAVLTRLFYAEFSSYPDYSAERLYDVTWTVTDFSPVFTEYTTFRYVWTVAIIREYTSSIPPPGYYYVDAATGEVFEYGI